jgi:7-carboxy-7-deazaguanine synthase
VIDWELQPGRNWLLVSEIFGPTVQGEGPTAGQLSMFIRLGGCNQHCSWCDSKYTWMFTERQVSQQIGLSVPFNPAEELKRYTVSWLRDWILESGVDLIVITGGEPLLQSESVATLISLVNEEVNAPRFEFETAGTVSPAFLTMFENVRFNVSPKLASSGNELELRRNIPVLKELDRQLGTAFKFVIGANTFDADIAEVQELRKLVGFEDERIWLMPEGITAEVVLGGQIVLAPIVLQHHWNLSTRLHVLLWGAERGR